VAADAAVDAISEMTRAAPHRQWEIQSFRDRWQLPSFARLGRAGTPVPPLAGSGLIAARNRYAIRLIPSCVFSSYDCRRAVAAAFRPQRDYSPVELCR